jgi:hypothetical protein
MRGLLLTGMAFVSILARLSAQCLEDRIVLPPAEWMSTSANTAIDDLRLLAIADANSDQELLDVLLKYGKNKYQWSALNYAIDQEDFNAARVLIRNGASCTQRDKTGSDSSHLHGPLFRIFAHRETYGCVHYLKPIDSWRRFDAALLAEDLITHHGLHVPEAEAYSIVEQFAMNEWHQVLELALQSKYRGSIRCEPNGTWTGIYNNVINRGSIQILELLDRYIYPDEELSDRDWALMLGERLICAVTHKQLGMIVYFIEHGADVNYVDVLGMSPLLRVVANPNLNSKNKDIIACLVAQGADVNLRDPNGMTPLELASRNGDKDVVEYLISVGAHL